MRHLMKEMVGKNRLNQLTQEEADYLLTALQQLEVKQGKIPTIPTTKALIPRDG